MFCMYTCTIFSFKQETAYEMRISDWSSDVCSSDLLLLNPDGSYTYTLTSPATTAPSANDGPNVQSESFTYQATDALGNSVTGNLVAIGRAPCRARVCK